jgi:hypothetical protein
VADLLSKKCLIVYASHTGNTEKVALRFKTTVEKRGWECDAFRIDQKTDLDHPAFGFNNYDFVCIGSGVELHEPYSEILAAIRIPRYGFDPRLPATRPNFGKGAEPVKHDKIIFGTESKKAIVFITYAGYDLGVREAEPALALLAVEIEHLHFQCIGRFCCLGKFLNGPTPETYYGDIRDRPNEIDLMKAEIFMDEMLDEIKAGSIANSLKQN